MDEQFLIILHAIEKITDVTPLREAAIQLPNKIYEIVKLHEQLTTIPAELTDQLVFDVSKTYYYSVIRVPMQIHQKHSARTKNNSGFPSQDNTRTKR